MPPFFCNTAATRTPTMKQLDEMDLTLYLQTEGRRMAAELRGKALAENRSPTPSAPHPPASAAQRPPSLQPLQQQCGAPAAGTQKPARSLSEALQRMGVAGSHPRRM